MPSCGKVTRSAQTNCANSRSVIEKSGRNSPAAGRKRGRLTVIWACQQCLNRCSKCAASAIASSCQADKRTDAEPAKTRRITALDAIEPKIKIAFRAGGMHFRINPAIVGLLINDKPFGARFHDRHVILRFHRAHFDRDRRKIRSERPNAFGEIVAASKFWVLARDKKNLTKSLTREMLRFGDDFIDIKCDAKDRIIARETAIPAVVNAFVGKIQRSE